ncbi:MAG: peptidylprolyl isomerase [Gammaproteobacteria bacterium]|nr:peptidylprolyl isomerase [Gammaproteobacteria bacterium]
MMESLRNFLTGPRLIIVVLICAAPFIFLGTESLSQGFGGFGKINGEKVTEQDLQRASNSAVLMFKNFYGEDFDFDALESEVKSESIKQQLTVQKVLYSYAKSLGLINNETRNEAKKEIMRSPAFQVNGEFNEDSYEVGVNSYGFTKESYIDITRDELASEQFRQSLNLIDFITNEEVYDLVKLLEKSADVDFIKIDFDKLKNNITNTTEEILDFYNDNQIDFYSLEERNFNYIVLEQDKYKQNIQVPQNYIENAFQQYITTYENSSQVRFAHIMIEKNQYSSDEDANKKIKEVEELLINGSDFSSIASQYSDDLITKDLGGDLEYFDADLWPSEFANAIQEMELNETSKIIELENTFHILKVTEINEQEEVPEEQIKKDLLNNLIETESLALMKDDLEIIEDMILENKSLKSIANEFSIELISSSFFNSDNFDFEIFPELEVKNYLFSDGAITDEPYVIEAEDKIIVMALNQTNLSKLMPFESVVEEASKSLIEQKALDRLELLTAEINTFEVEEERIDFINSYTFITNDIFFDVKRNSSLLPREVLNKVFENQNGTTFDINSSLGDKYIVKIKDFKTPNETQIQENINEYQEIAKEIQSSKIIELITEDVFDSAEVNLKNFIF